MDTTILKSLSDVGVIGVLGYAVYFLIKYIKSKDDAIEKLIEVNQTQNESIKENNTFLKELSDRQKKLLEYSDYGLWWVNHHQPTPEVCSKCPNYQDCVHPRKIIQR